MRLVSLFILIGLLNLWALWEAQNKNTKNMINNLDLTLDDSSDIITSPRPTMHPLMIHSNTILAPPHLL